MSKNKEQNDFFSYNLTTFFWFFYPLKTFRALFFHWICYNVIPFLRKCHFCDLKINLGGLYEQKQGTKWLFLAIIWSLFLFFYPLKIFRALFFHWICYNVIPFPRKCHLCDLKINFRGLIWAKTRNKMTFLDKFWPLFWFFLPPENI